MCSHSAHWHYPGRLGDDSGFRNSATIVEALWHLVGDVQQQALTREAVRLLSSSSALHYIRFGDSYRVLQYFNRLRETRRLTPRKSTLFYAGSRDKREQVSDPIQPIQPILPGISRICVVVRVFTFKLYLALSSVMA
jgi:hypothetical protein